MRRIFTLRKQAACIATIALIVFCSYNAKSQTNATATNCISQTGTACVNPVTNDFNTSDEGFSGSSPATTYAYNSTDGNFQVGGATAATTSPNTNYILTSGTYAADGRITVGFDLGGTATIGAVTVDILGTNNTVLATCNFNYNAAGGSVCFTLEDQDLVSQTVRFRITTRTRSNSQGGAGTLSFDNFRAAFAPIIPLPVNFISFKATKAANGTQLTWNVADEFDVQHYEVERSSNGQQFSKIGTVPAADQSTYTFVDAQPANGAVFYRVKNVDIDGRYKYSTVLTVRNGTAAIVLKAFPTPALRNLTLQHNEATASALISVSAADGRTVISIRPATRSVQTEMDLGGLPAGMYVVRFDNGNGQVETLKISKR